MAFWSSALYGAAPCPLAGNYLHQLRQAANKALRCKHAARNALLRFSLSDKMDADPGFFHLVSVFQTFRRVCGRSPRVLDCWRLWQSSFDGCITHGPFVCFWGCWLEHWDPSHGDRSTWTFSWLAFDTMDALATLAGGCVALLCWQHIDTRFHELSARH